MICLYLPRGLFSPKIILVNRNYVGILSLQMTQFGMLLPSLLGSILTANNSVQDASALHLGSILTANTSVQDASALHLGSILTAKYLSSGYFCPPSHLGSILTANTSIEDASVLTSALHPRCQIPQFRMLLSSLLGSILTAKYLSSGCFCPHFWAPSSLQESLLTLTYRWRVCII